MSWVLAMPAFMDEALLKLVQCATLAHWEAAEALNVVEAREVKVRRLVSELAATEAQASEAHGL